MLKFSTYPLNHQIMGSFLSAGCLEESTTLLYWFCSVEANHPRKGRWPLWFVLTLFLYYFYFNADPGILGFAYAWIFASVLKLYQNELWVEKKYIFWLPDWGPNYVLFKCDCFSVNNSKAHGYTLIFWDFLYLWSVNN